MPLGCASINMCIKTASIIAILRGSKWLQNFFFFFSDLHDVIRTLTLFMTIVNPDYSNSNLVAA